MNETSEANGWSEVRNFFSWAGYYTNTASREFGRTVERCTRPFKYGEHGFAATKWREIATRVQCAAVALICVPFALVGGPLSMVLLTPASLIDTFHLAPRLNVLELAPPPPATRTFTVTFLNLDGQAGGFAAKTGGTTDPRDPPSLGDDTVRIAALANWFAAQKLGSKQAPPDVVCCQELHDYKTQEIMKEMMGKHGYALSAVDLGPHPLLWQDSGLAAFVKEKCIFKFIPYPIGDRAGLARLSLQGAVVTTLLDEQGEKIIDIYNTHLNYPDKKDDVENQNARNRQLKRHILPHFLGEDPALLGGDFNSDTAIHGKEMGLDGLKNYAEGQITCTEEGLIHLRGEDPTTCQDTSIDALIPNSDRVLVRDFRVQKVLSPSGALLTDHFALSAEIEVSK